MASGATKARTFAALQFQKKWRAYQSRVLEAMDSYLDDHRLHLVAAPGSGKTILGIEIVRRLDQPTLVLVPTITIREQWIDRLVECFLPPGESKPAWISCDLKNPTAFTVATYQALHALCTAAEPHVSDAEDQQDENESYRAEPEFYVPQTLANTRFNTLVVDEAHHLRAQWWKALNCFVDGLVSPTIVALTATPPYDVPPLEWERYEKLCGPVDTEVSVPDLVQAGDLCPHQDYVYLSTPSDQDQRSVRAFRVEVARFLESLKNSQQFTETVKTHPWLQLSEDYSAEIHDNLAAFLSLVIYLNGIAGQPPEAALRLLRTRRRDLPPLDLEWLERLLTHYLYDSATWRSPNTELVRALRDQLRDISALEHRKVTLRRPAGASKWLTDSPSKLQSIEAIVRLEQAALGDALRLAILTDFIRRDSGQTGSAQAVGVVPIFEKLRAARISGVSLACSAVLSSSFQRTADRLSAKLPAR